MNYNMMEIMDIKNNCIDDFPHVEYTKEELVVFYRKLKKYH
jgi:hypothetical protein